MARSSFRLSAANSGARKPASETRPRGCQAAVNKERESSLCAARPRVAGTQPPAGAAETPAPWGWRASWLAFALVLRSPLRSVCI